MVLLLLLLPLACVAGPTNNKHIISLEIGSLDLEEAVREAHDYVRRVKNGVLAQDRMGFRFDRSSLEYYCF